MLFELSILNDKINYLQSYLFFEGKFILSFNIGKFKKNINTFLNLSILNDKIYFII